MSSKFDFWFALKSKELENKGKDEEVVDITNLNYVVTLSNGKVVTSKELINLAEKELTNEKDDSERKDKVQSNEGMETVKNRKTSRAKESRCSDTKTPKKRSKSTSS